MSKTTITIISSITIFIVLIVSALNYHNINVLESRINTVLKNSKDLDTAKSFKEDYYILQQAHDTNLILVVFGLVIAFMGFYTYQNVVEKFESKIAELKKGTEAYKSELKREFEDYKIEWQDSITELDELQKEFFIQSAELCNEFAENSYAQGNKPAYLQHAIAVVSKTADLCCWNMKHNKDNVEDIAKLQETILVFVTDINKKITTTIFLSETALPVVVNFINSIRRIESPAVDKELSIIHSKLKQNAN